MYLVWSLDARMYLGRGESPERALEDARRAYPAAVGSRVRIERSGLPEGPVVTL